MPDVMACALDAPASGPDAQDRASLPVVRQPASIWAAMARGGLGRCPRCGEAALFRAFLKPVAHCPHCLQDWTLERADDFPPYVSLFITGHLMAPLAVHLALRTDMSLLAISAIVLPLVLVVATGILQPAKGAIIALQWWMGMHGFNRLQPPEPAEPHPQA